MAQNKKDNPNMEFPLQIARQYPAPLDKHSLFYSLADAEDYAKNSPLAYVGQLISVVNETDNTVDIYKIMSGGDLDGTIKAANKLSNANLIDGVAFDGSTDMAHYGTSLTHAITAEKVVKLKGFKLVEGAKITVKFFTANSSSSPSLNVNGTGAKSIRCCERSTGLVWLADSIIEFLYDGTYWQIIGGYVLADKPVGTIYESYNSGNPKSLFGGEWVEHDKGLYQLHTNYSLKFQQTVSQGVTICVGMATIPANSVAYITGHLETTASDSSSIVNAKIETDAHENDAESRTTMDSGGGVDVSTIITTDASAKDIYLKTYGYTSRTVIGWIRALVFKKPTTYKWRRSS